MAFTPSLDEMARGEHSIRFDRFYSSSPVCSPTRGSLLTGRNHNRYCLWMANTAGRNCPVREDFLCPIKHPLLASELTIAEILKEQGYKTFTVGKWHLGELGAKNGRDVVTSNPGDNGFDAWKVTERAVPTSTPNCGCFNTSQCILGHYRKRGPPPCTNYHEPASNSSLIQGHPEIILKDDSEFIADEFSEFLNTTLSDDRDAPFFAYIPFHSVHTYYIATPPYDTPYRTGKFQEKEVDYYASISALDSAVGRIRTLLREYNVSDNTMLWFSSDNGPAERSPGTTKGLRGRKKSLYEGGIRVPGIVEWPDIIKGNRRSSYPVVTSDFFPTVIDSLGLHDSLNKSREMDGISLLPLLQNRTERNSEGDETRKNAIKWAFNLRGSFLNPHKAVIMDNNFKLIANFNKGKSRKVKLYDLSKDPSETQDVSHENSALTEKLLSQLKKWIKSVKNSAEDNKCIENS